MPMESLAAIGFCVRKADGVLSHKVSIDRPKAADTLHVYAYGYIDNNKDGNNEWNCPRPL
jgi:hypothetical protein